MANYSLMRKFPCKPTSETVQLYVCSCNNNVIAERRLFYVIPLHTLCMFFARFRLTFWGQRIAARPLCSGQRKNNAQKKSVNIIGNNRCCGSANDHQRTLNQHSNNNENSHNVTNNSFHQSSLSDYKINYLNVNKNLYMQTWIGLREILEFTSWM